MGEAPLSDAASECHTIACSPLDVKDAARPKVLANDDQSLPIEGITGTKAGRLG